MNFVLRRIGILTGGCLGLWALLALPSRYLWGDAAAVSGGVAAILCLVPTTLTLAWAGWALGRPSDEQLIMVLGGTGVRMFFVLLSALALYSYVPYLQEQRGFWLWVLIFYLFTLALETVLIVGGRPTIGKP
jgi:hypothetical protein